MSAIGYGPPARLEGPPAVRRQYGLIQAGEASAPGVRLLADADGEGNERWIGGASVVLDPSDEPTVFDQCAPGSELQSKPAGSPLPTDDYASFAVIVPVTCSTFGLGSQDEFRSRALQALRVVEGYAVEQELLSGDLHQNNPHLSDGTGTFPNLNVATNVRNGLALLEQEIANQGHGKLGLIHVSPQLNIFAGAAPLEIDSGMLRTINGTPVIPGAGYATGVNPTGHPAATGTQEWIYASGPVDIRASELFTIPDNVAEAMDRSQNEVTYRAERYFLVTWDTTIHAAVLVDRCLAGCV